MERAVYFRLKGDPDSSQAKTKVSMKAEGWPLTESHTKTKLSDIQVPRGGCRRGSQSWLGVTRERDTNCYPLGKISRDIGLHVVTWHGSSARSSHRALCVLVCQGGGCRRRQKLVLVLYHTYPRM